MDIPTTEDGCLDLEPLIHGKSKIPDQTTDLGPDSARL
jgi:hypothetical protein